MRVVAARGANAYDLVSAAGARGLYDLPARLRHVVFIRPGSTVLVLERRGESKVRGDIDAVVLGVHLKEMRKDKLWPAAWRQPRGGDEEDGGEVVEGAVVEGEQEGSDSESEIEANPNTRKADMYSDSEDD